jgi:hypothetical protein
MFRHKRPSSSLQVVVMKETAGHCNTLLLSYVIASVRPKCVVSIKKNKEWLETDIEYRRHKSITKSQTMPYVKLFYLLVRQPVNSNNKDLPDGISTKLETKFVLDDLTSYSISDKVGSSLRLWTGFTIWVCPRFSSVHPRKRKQTFLK